MPSAPSAPSFQTENQSVKAKALAVRPRPPPSAGCRPANRLPTDPLKGNVVVPSARTLTLRFSAPFLLGLGERPWRADHAEGREELVPIIQAKQYRVVTGRRLAKYHRVPRLKAGQHPA